MGNLAINVIFTIFMCALAFWDYRSYGKQKHRDFKSIIMSAGVLGTFVGIFVGLQDFDVSNVENSVPSLLAGLKTAFYTSILGMALAILLSILQKSKAVKSDFDQMLEYFSLQMGHLDKLKELEKLESLNALVAQNKELIEVQNMQNNQLVQNSKILSDGFNGVSVSLKEAMHHLAQGASKELITALQEVIKDFNMRITDQFGDNFKELNKAVSQMISWQDGYKESIVVLESNLKNTLSLFDSTKDSLELVARRNSEVLEVYNALAHSIEASRIENEKLEQLLKNFGNLYENANKALESVKDLNINLKQTHTNALEFTKNALQEVQGFITTSSKALQENMQNSLDVSLKGIEVESKKQQESMQELQSAFNTFNVEYITQNKTHLQESLEFVQNKLEQFMIAFTENDSQLKHKNLEMVTQIEASMKERLESVRDSFNTNLEVLENAQKESILLIEEQAKRSDDVLIRHTQNMEGALEKTSNHLKQLSEQIAQNLTKNSNTLEQHITNAVLNFDTLLGNTTKTLQENFEDSKEALTTLSKEIENSMVVTTKSLDTLLNDTANTLNKSTQNIEESLVHTSEALQESFTKLSTTISENLAITTKDLGKSVEDLLEQNSKNSQNLQNLLTQNVEHFSNALGQMHKESQEYSKQMQGQIRLNFAESYKNALESLGAFLKNTTSAYQKELQDLSANTMQIQERIGEGLKGQLEKIAHSFESNAKQVLQTSESFANALVGVTNEKLEVQTKQLMANYNALDANVKTTLQEMAKNYLGMLEILTKQSLETPKNASVELLNAFNKLQTNLGEALTQTYLSLENNRKEIDAILKITQTNISNSLSQTANLNETLCKSLGELDNALSNITLGFRQDYEWFLRRIRELMGVRG